MKTNELVAFFDHHPNYDLLRADTIGLELSEAGKQNSMPLDICSVNTSNISKLNISKNDKVFEISGTNCKLL